MRRLAFASLILAAICGVVVFVSCKRSSNRTQHIELRKGPRNLTPGLSEELTTVASRYRGQWIFIVEPPDDEEARNLAGLIAKALETGGWQVLGRIVSPEARQVKGIYCTYPTEEGKVADDLRSVFQQKALLIECEQSADNSFRRPERPLNFPALILAVGLNHDL